MYKTQRALLVLCFLVITSAAQAGNCPGANPNDNLPDDDALQACLNQGGTITLDPGNPGYILAKGLQLNVSGTILTSSQGSTRATLVAAAGIPALMLASEGQANNYQVLNLTFDGNKANRNDSNCSSSVNGGYRGAESNLEFRGSGFLISNVESKNALCGSAFQVLGSNFELSNNYVHDNGHTSNAVDEPMSDGMTIAWCDHGYIHNNTLADNTDLDIVDGGGLGCQIISNTIQQNTSHAFGGIGVSAFSTTADFTGTVVQNNTVNSAINQLDFGIVAGMHAWFPGNATNGGSIINNTVSGARINLTVQGFYGGTVNSNTLSNPQGTFGNCSAMNYAVAESSNDCLQSGWIVKGFNISGSCYDTGETITSTCSGGTPPPPPPSSLNASTFVSQSVPTSMTAGQTYSVSVTMQNSGSSTWSASGTNPYRLGSQNPQDNGTWGTSRIDVVGSVAPGQQATFTFNVTAPATGGTYNFQWEMVQELVQWFGPMTPNVAVAVTAASVSTTSPAAPAGLRIL